jgi:hypothetical protein
VLPDWCPPFSGYTSIIRAGASRRRRSARSSRHCVIVADQDEGRIVKG